jgi:ABC-type transporter Mla MlaB component
MAPYILDEAAQPARLTLSGACTVEEAASLHEALARALAASDGVSLDLTAVDYVDVTLVQLLLAVLLAAPGQGKRVELAGEPSAAVRDALRLTGVECSATVMELFGRAGINSCAPDGR